MPRAIRFLVAIIALCPVAGCMLLNNVVRLEDNKVVAPSRDRAVVVFGIAVEGAWRYPQFGVALDEYNPEKSAITGNCWRYNRVQASAPSGSGSVRHFAFDAAPGYYIFSGFNAVSFRGENTFFVPEGNVVYLGDFVYTADGSVVLRRDIAAAMSPLRKRFPNLKEEIVMAKTTSGLPTIFLCAP